MEIDNVIERLEKQIDTWQEKLEGFNADLRLAEEKCSALESGRDKHIFAAKGEGNKNSQVKLDEVRTQLIVVEIESNELAVLVEQTTTKIADLETSLEQRRRELKIFDLDALRTKRFDLAKTIEKEMDILVPLLAEFKELGFEMYTEGQALGAGHASLYAHNRAVNYLHEKLSELFPHDFHRPLSKQRGSLFEIDTKTVNAVLSAKGLLPKAV